MGAVSEASNGATNGTAPPDERVEALRAMMAKAKVDAYIIPTEDPHMVQACILFPVYLR
jgi:hypothetical protein